MIGRVERIDDYDNDLAEWAAQNNDRPPSPPPLLPRISRRNSPSSPVSPTSSRDSRSSSPAPQFISTPALMAMCHTFLNQLHAGTAPWVVQRLNYNYGPQPPDSDPATFSFWMGMVLPIDEHEKAKLLPVKSARLRLRMVVGWIEQLNSNWSVLLRSNANVIHLPFRWFTSGCTVL